MPLGFGSPYRAPCAGWSSPLVVSLGPENQHCNPGDNGKPIWQNLTVLFDSSAPTGNPSAPPTLHACSGGQTLIGDNCYQVQSPAAYKNFSTCHKYGFKNLVGVKYWHGRLGFAGGDCGGSYASTPNGTRYRTKAMVGTSESGTRVLLVFTPLTTASTGRTYTVARYTGLVAETSKVDVGYTGSGFNSAQKAAQFDYQCGSWVDTGGRGSGIVDVLNGTPDASVSGKRSGLPSIRKASPPSSLRTIRGTRSMNDFGTRPSNMSPGSVMWLSAEMIGLLMTVCMEFLSKRFLSCRTSRDGN